MKSLIKKYKPALLLLMTSVLAYGMMIPWLGFYWDDMPMAWFADTLGPLGFKDVLAMDRPFLTGIYMITTSILPIKPIYWQIFALFSRWVCGLALFWALTKIWPKLDKQMLWVSILFTVFPGFKQQPISMIYGNGFILLTSFFLSLGLMIRAMELTSKKKVFAILGSVLLQIFTIFSTEYYAGLELLRILIIWFKYDLDLRKFKVWFRTIFREYYPYAIGLVLFFIWRVFIFKFPTYKPVNLSEFSGSRYPAVITFLNRMLQDIYLTIWKSWTEIFQFPNINLIRGSSEIFYWIIVILLIPVFYFLLRSNSGSTEKISLYNKQFSKIELQLIVFSIAAILLGAFPFWATNLPIQLQYPYDRFFLSLMLGSSLLAVFLINKFLSGENTKLIVLSLLIGFSIGSHINNANTYRREWTVLNDFFWQLSWRAPDIAENTMILSETFPLEYYSDNSLTAPLNWIYDTSDSHIPLKYMMFFTDIRLGGSLSSLEPGIEVTKNYRSTDFIGNTNQVLGFFYTTDACLRILDPELSRDDPLLPETINSIIKLSDPSLILKTTDDNQARPDKTIFSTEPNHGWCYYFEKADLARQNKDWDTIVEIEKILSDNQMSTDIASEYLPFIEGMAATGNWEAAIAYIDKAHNRDKNIEKLLCREMMRYQIEYAESYKSMDLLQDKIDTIGCKSIIK
jgi:hypothetical protein